MRAGSLQLKGGLTKMEDPPKLTEMQWNVSGLLGVVFVVMALLQVISFSDFKDWLSGIGIDSPAVCAVVIIIAELIAGIGFFKLRLSSFFRWVSGGLAILAVGFWFVENLRLVSDGMAGQLDNSGLFGRYLPQSPGWWTVLEVTILLFWVIYALTAMKNAPSRTK